jgi:hypothetical protein
LFSGTYEFQGFSPFLPIWLLLVVFLIGIAVTILTYKNYNSISGLNKLSLIGLRISAYLILIILLANPVLIQVKTLEKKQEIGVLIDNSASIAIQKGSWDGITSINSVLTDFFFNGSDDIDIKLFGFGPELYEINNISDLTFDEGSTDINRVINQSKSFNELDQIILISDGISTRGRDPIFSGLNSPLPIHTIAVGDTSFQKDIVLLNVDYPPSTYVNSITNIVATIRNEGYNNETVQIGLYKNSNLLSSKRITFSQNRSTHQINFEFSTESQGQQQFEIRVSTLPDEWNVENNSRSFSINVLDDRIRVLHIAFELHPDVGTLRNILYENPAIFLKERTWVEGNRFIEGPVPASTDTIDVIIIHGYPDVNSQDLALSIREMTSNNSFLFVLTPGTSLNRLQSAIDGNFQFNTVANSGGSVIQLSPTTGSTGHVITQIDEIDWNRSPNVNSNVNMSQSDVRMQSILSGQNRNTGMTQPALSVIQNGNFRNSFILFSGFYIWSLSDDPFKKAIEQLLTNLVTWTATDSRDDLFEISTSENEYNRSDEILFNARVINDSGAPENDAIITLQLVSENRESSLFTLSPIGLGNYSLSIPPLPVGTYKFEAIAEKDQLLFGEKSGLFTVGSTNIELVETRRNDNVLRTISENSGGQFFVYDQLPNLIEIIGNLSHVQNTQFIKETKMINRNPIWFILLIIFVGCEWFIRKRVLLP